MTNGIPSYIKQVSATVHYDLPLIWTERDPFFAYNNGKPIDAQRVPFHENWRQGSPKLQIGNGNHTTFTEMEAL